jgi:hypothetical protein
MSSITVSSLVLGSLTVEVDGSDSTLALSVLGTAPATLSIELGTPGATGTAATIAVGTTTTLAPGSPATVTNVGTSSAATFNFGIPQGIAGPTGATGAGVPVGGTDGQVLAKIDATDYNTQWATAFALQVRNQVRNETGATLTKGTVVYVTGASGNKVTVSKAQANGDATSAQTFAILLENIPNNQNGYAVTSGLLENLDTSAYAAGTQLYLSPTVAGTYTSTKPSAPDHLVYVGVIERSHVNQGTMLVRIQNGYELEELHNVAIAGLANNDLLAYDSATDLWKNKTFGTLGLLTTASAASTYAPLASPALTGTPTAPTATAGTNTTQIATTAFVTAAVPAIATTAQALIPTSTTVALSPDAGREMIMYPGYVQMYGGGNLGTSGTGALATITFASQRWHALAGPNTGVAGYGAFVFDYSFSGIGMAAMTRGVSALSRKWNSKIWASGRTILGQSAETTSGFNGDANTTARVMVGGRSSLGTGGMVSTENGFGWKVAGGGSAALVLTVSNGTTLTEVTSSFTPTLQQVFDWKIYSDGAGNVTLWVNDSQVATSTGGPTTSTAEIYNFYLEIVDQTASTATRFAMGNFGTKVFWAQP